MHWISEFRCRTCQTVLRYEDEAPDWKPSERIARDMEAAQELLGMVVPTHWMYGEPTPPDYLRYDPLKHVLRTGRKEGSLALHVLAVEFDNRCIDCPTCGAEVFVRDAVAVATAFGSPGARALHGKADAVREVAS